MSVQTLLAEAVLGKDAEEFLRSDLGRYLVGRARMEGRDAMEKLKNTSPWRRRRIQQLQNEIHRAESFEAWLIELVSSGKAAEAALEDQEIDS